MRTALRTWVHGAGLRFLPPMEVNVGRNSVNVKLGGARRVRIRSEREVRLGPRGSGRPGDRREALTTETDRSGERVGGAAPSSGRQPKEGMGRGGSSPGRYTDGREDPARIG